MYILRFAAELSSGACTQLPGEVNCDGVVNIADAAVVLQAAAEGAQSIEPCHPAATATEEPTGTPEPAPTATPFLSEDLATPGIR
jgi:hypothetical protein